MRFQIHRLQQEALIELGLNVEDALLLDWLLNWKDGNSMERIVVGDDVAYAGGKGAEYHKSAKEYYPRNAHFSYHVFKNVSKDKG